jgi:hypothetical protein
VVGLESDNPMTSQGLNLNWVITPQKGANQLN